MGTARPALRVPVSSEVGTEPRKSREKKGVMNTEG